MVGGRGGAGQVEPGPSGSVIVLRYIEGGDQAPEWERLWPGGGRGGAGCGPGAVGWSRAGACSRDDPLHAHTRTNASTTHTRVRAALCLICTGSS